MKSLVIPCEEEVEDYQENEEAYDDIDSFDSPGVTLHQDTTVDTEDEEDLRENHECIYEVLPGELTFVCIVVIPVYLVFMQKRTKKITIFFSLLMRE